MLEVPKTFSTALYNADLIHREVCPFPSFTFFTLHLPPSPLPSPPRTSLTFEQHTGRWLTHEERKTKNAQSQNSAEKYYRMFLYGVEDKKNFDVLLKVAGSFTSPFTFHPSPPLHPSSPSGLRLLPPLAEISFNSVLEFSKNHVRFLTQPNLEMLTNEYLNSEEFLEFVKTCEFSWSPEKMMVIASNNGKAGL